MTVHMMQCFGDSVQCMNSDLYYRKLPYNGWLPYMCNLPCDTSHLPDQGQGQLLDFELYLFKY